MLFVSCFSHAFVLFIGALWSPAGNGLISGLLLVIVLLYLCYFSMWYPRSGVVLDCIVS